MLGTHSFSNLIHQRKNIIQNKCQLGNTKLNNNNKDIKPNIIFNFEVIVTTQFSMFHNLFSLFLTHRLFI